MFTARNRSYRLNTQLIGRVVRLTILGLLLGLLTPMAPLAARPEQAASAQTTYSSAGTIPGVMVKISLATPTAVTLSSFEASPPVLDLAGGFRQLLGLR